MESKSVKMNLKNFITQLKHTSAMSTKKGTKSEELFTSVDENRANPSYPLVNIQKVEGTPFHIASDENGHIVAIGKYRLTEVLETIEEARATIYSLDWNLLMNLIALVAKFEVEEQLLDEKLKTNN